MRFYNVSMHISVIADMKQIFEEIGHKVDDHTISGHAWVMKRKPSDVGVNLRSELPRFIKSKIWDRFREMHPELDKYDGFIVDYPPAFALLFMAFDKPVIMNIPIRYEYPWSADAIQWECFNILLRDMYQRKKLYPVANNIYDKIYFEYFTGIPCNHIPSMCAYTGMQYTPTKKVPLVYAKKPVQDLKKSSIWVESIKPYKWKDIASYPAIIHFPYNVSTMSIFEHYNACIPMAFPSLKYLKELYQHSPIDVMGEYSWTKTLKLGSGSAIHPPVNHSKRPDPNNYESMRGIDMWWRHADYYDGSWMPYIFQFNSMQELKNWISNKGYLLYVQKQRMFLERHRRPMIYDLWKGLLGTL